MRAEPRPHAPGATLRAGSPEQHAFTVLLGCRTSLQSFRPNLCVSATISARSMPCSPTFLSTAKQMPLIVFSRQLFTSSRVSVDGTFGFLFVGVERFPPTATPSEMRSRSPRPRRGSPRSDRPVRRPSRPIGRCGCRWRVERQDDAAESLTEGGPSSGASRPPRRARRVVRLAHDASRMVCDKQDAGGNITSVSAGCASCGGRGSRVRCPADGEGT